MASELSSRISSISRSDRDRDTTLSVREFRLAEACLVRSQLPWRNDTPPSSDFLKSSTGRMRLLHATWSATAYSLLTMCCASTATDNAEAVGSVGDVDWVVIRQLTKFLQSGDEWVDTDSVQISNNLRCALLQLVAPTDADLAAYRLQIPTCPLARHAPTPVVLDLQCPADEYGHIENIAKEWPLLAQPLLTHDLHTLAVAVTTSTSDKILIRNYIAVLCLARLAQIMIEPLCTGRLDSSPVIDSMSNAKAKRTDTSPDGGKKRLRECYEATASDTALSMSHDESLSSSGAAEVFAPDGLEQWRAHVCAAARVPCHPCPLIQPPTNGYLEAIVLDSWIPYLEFACSLYSTLLGDNSGGGGLPWCGKGRSDGTYPSTTTRVMHMVSVVGLDGMKRDSNVLDKHRAGPSPPSPRLCPVSCPLACDLASAWGAMYDIYYAGVQVSNRDCVESAPRQAGRPRGYTHNDEDMVRDCGESEDEGEGGRGGGVEERGAGGEEEDLSDGGVDLGEVHIVDPLAVGDDYDTDEDVNLEDGDEYGDDEDDEDDEDGIGNNALTEELIDMDEEILQAGDGAWPAQIANWLLQMGVSEADTLALRAEGHAIGGVTTEMPWGLIGVDPDLTPYTVSNAPCVAGEEPPLGRYPSLLGSVSGSCAAYITGIPDQSVIIRTQLVDVSHLGLGIRHGIGLVNLPHKFTDLYKQVSGMHVYVLVRLYMYV